MPESLREPLDLTSHTSGILLSVLVPVYNERATVSEVIARVKAVPIEKEIIVVDDGSTDGTREILLALDRGDDLRVVLHDANRGKGASLRTAMALARGDIVVIQDADLEYDPQQYATLIQPIVDGTADVVYGARFLSPVPRGGLEWHRAANRAITKFSNAFTGLALNDMESCYKVFRKDVMQAIAPLLRENRFGIDPEVTAKLARRNYRIAQVPVDYAGRSFAEGKKIGFWDGVRVLYCVVRYWWGD
jgi:glycosyltransferase involved in cell wall biosynthesis